MNNVKNYYSAIMEKNPKIKLETDFYELSTFLQTTKHFTIHSSTSQFIQCLKMDGQPLGLKLSTRN